MIKNIFKNASYYSFEFLKIFKQNFISNIFSIISTGLIFILLAMTISGWWISTKLIENLKNEAEISIFFKEDYSENKINALMDDIKSVNGILTIKYINKDQAYIQMNELLENDTEILEIFDENPFAPFLEVSIDINSYETILASLDNIDGIEYIKNNKDILENLKKILYVIKFLGIFVLISIFISTIIIVSHMIKLGLNNNKEQIKTLRLLGAPKRFIAIPFLLNGILITFSGSTISLIIILILGQKIFFGIMNTLPFLPLDINNTIINQLILFIYSFGLLLAVFGTFFGMQGKKE